MIGINISATERAQQLLEDIKEVRDSHVELVKDLVPELPTGPTVDKEAVEIVKEAKDREQEIKVATAAVRMLKSDVRGASWIRRCLLPWWTNEPGAEEMEKLEDRVANLRTDTMNTTAKAKRLIDWKNDGGVLPKPSRALQS